MKLIKH